MLPSLRGRQPAVPDALQITRPRQNRKRANRYRHPPWQTLGAHPGLAWIWDFSSAHSTTAPSGGLKYKPTTSNNLSHEQRISRQLERLRPVRLEVEAAPDPPDRGPGQATTLRHRRARPVGGVPRCFLQRRDHHVLDLVHRDRRWPARTRLVHQTLQTVTGEPGPPLAHRWPGHPQSLRNLHIGQSVGARQHDTTPQRQRLRRLRPPRPPRQHVTLPISENQLDLRASRLRHTTQTTHSQRISGAGH